jgi:Mg2+ and Co2+ transporter CorA
MTVSDKIDEIEREFKYHAHDADDPRARMTELFDELLQISRTSGMIVDCLVSALESANPYLKEKYGVQREAIDNVTVQIERAVELTKTIKGVRCDREAL